MYIQLMRRHYGVHNPVKYIEIPCNFSDVYLHNDCINEKLLLENIPEGWLPVPPSEILLMVGDDDSGTGQCGLKLFRNWSKYYDSYSLELREKPSKWWDELWYEQDEGVKR